MIEYCLNYYEDFVQECKTKRILCIGYDHTFNSDKRELLSGFIKKIDYWVTYEEFFSSPFEENSSIVSISFERLNAIDLNEYVFLIISDYVDYMKIKLKELVSDDTYVKCYTYKFAYRDYYDEKKLKSNRLDKVAMYWYQYYLTHVLEIQQKEQLITKREHALCKNEIRVIPRLVVVLTTKCNLSCKDCIALTTHYKHPYDIPADIIIKSLEKITKVIDECICVELIGGEPFMYKYLPQVLRYLKNHSKIKFIQITTNGIVFDYNNEYKELLTGNVMVRVSDYSISDNTNEFVSWLKSNKIHHTVQKDLVWIPVADVSDKNKKSQDKKDEYNLCFEGLHCKTLLKGVLYDCTFSSRICDLGYAEQCQIIDVLKERVTWERLFRYWIRNESNACSYCNIMNPNTELVKSARQKNDK